MIIKSPFLTTAEAAEYLRFAGPNPKRTLWKWLQRQGIRTYKRGRAVLVRREDLDAALIERRTA